MEIPKLSRRNFPLVAGAGLLAAAETITARQIIERIQKNVGVPWRSETVDTFKAGNPDTPVQGIATTVMSTLDVLRRAAASGKNLIISHEPTFYNHEDKTQDFSADPVYLAKQAFIEKNRIVIWRFHDHWHARKPDGILLGFAQAVGWEKYQAPQDQRLYEVPATSLDALVYDLQTKLKARAFRVIGDRQTRIAKIAINLGYTSLMSAVRVLPNVDVFICGEPREWEVVEYAQDAVASGAKKALIILGHAISEDPGMDYCAKWLKQFITEVPIEWVPAGEPFWRPS